MGFLDHGIATLAKLAQGWLHVLAQLPNAGRALGEPAQAQRPLELLPSAEPHRACQYQGIFAPASSR